MSGDPNKDKPKTTEQKSIDSKTTERSPKKKNSEKSKKT